MMMRLCMEAGELGQDDRNSYDAMWIKSLLSAKAMAVQKVQEQPKAVINGFVRCTNEQDECVELPIYGVFRLRN